ncbi:MAG TPA: carboxypeptidase-like regulatory domain-containing protein [Vicinamibacterales bacterium]|nr:carboxypeptidase-like regulatory domain-containing protein [Vicinamibacterales bacterium]
MMQRIGAWLFVMLAAATVVAAQQTARDATPPRPGTASIEGTLVAIDSGRPVRRARVSLSSVGGGAVGQSVTTDDLGGFLFKDLPAGSYNLAASKPGYLDSIYGQRRPGTGRPGTPIQLTDGQHLEKLTFQLARGGAIMGTVVDEQGEPVFGQQVRVYRYTRQSGERTLQSAGSDTTDDRGQYRIPVLLPGEYIVSMFPRESPSDAAVQELKIAAESMAASARAGADEQMLVRLKEDIARARDIKADETSDSYAPVYYPGTTQASGAQSIMIEVGQERAGVDLQQQLVRTSKISGVVSAPADGGPGAVAGTTILLVDTDQIIPGVTSRTAHPGPDGQFTVSGVPPGHYMVIARSAPLMSRTIEGPTADSPAVKVSSTSGPMQYWAMSELIADGRNVSDLALVLQKGMSVSGAVKTDASGGQTFDLARVRLTLTPVGALANAQFPQIFGTADTAGRFALSGVMPGKYKIAVAGPPAAWTMKSAIFGGRDVLDFPLEVKPSEDQGGGVITLTTHPGTLSGMLQDPSGQPTAAYTIIVFPLDERLWAPPARRIMSTRPSTDGRYSFSGLAPGEYRLVAVTDVEPGQWYDPAFLRELGGVSLPITLGDGERRVQDLRVK